MKPLFVLLAALLVAAPVAEAQYAFEPVVCPGMTVLVVTGINNAGVMVGAYTVEGDPSRHALIIENGECQPLGPETILNTHFSIAVGVNDRGDVVGVYMDDTRVNHGFLLDKRGVLTTIDLPGAGGTWLDGINNSGTIVGYGEYFDPEGNFLSVRGFTWADDVFNKIEIGSFEDFIGGINARGDFAGEADLQLLIYGNGTYTVLADIIPGAVYVQGDGINAKGEVAGLFMDADNVQHGFVMSGASITRVDFPGKDGTFLLGINNAGVVGGSYWEGGRQLAFIARPIK